jgi:hypothetical protein
MSVKVDPGSAAIAYQFGIEHTRPEISTTAIRAIRFSGKSRMDPVATAHNASARTPCGLEAQDKREHKRADPPILAQYTRALTTVTVPANCMIENGLNLQPRKCLGYLTPHEVSHNLDLLQLLRFTVECKLFFIFRVETSVDKGPCSYIFMIMATRRPEQKPSLLVQRHCASSIHQKENAPSKS